jgi:hypothetical protein
MLVAAVIVFVAGILIGWRFSRPLAGRASLPRRETALLLSRLPCEICGAEWGEPCDAGSHS